MLLGLYKRTNEYLRKEKLWSHRSLRFLPWSLKSWLVRAGGNLPLGQNFYLFCSPVAPVTRTTPDTELKLFLIHE